MATNSITIIGNLTRDPEMRYTPSGQANARFGVAVNRRWQNRQSNEWEEATSFFDVICWRELAENAADSLSKGSRVIVTGRLEQRSWESSNGDKRSSVEIIADEIGPSLRYATAEVKRNERKDSMGGPGPGGGGGSMAASRSGGGQPGPQEWSAEEEPF